MIKGGGEVLFTNCTRGCCERSPLWRFNGGLLSYKGIQFWGSLARWWIGKQEEKVQVLGKRPDIYDELSPIALDTEAKSTPHARTIHAQTQCTTLESWRELSAPLTYLLQLPASVVRPTCGWHFIGISGLGEQSSRTLGGDKQVNLNSVHF